MIPATGRDGAADRRNSAWAFRIRRDLARGATRGLRRGPQQKAMIDAVSQLGILMLLLLTGMETDLRLVKQARRAAISTSAAGIVVPFACGFALGELLPAAMLPKPDQRIITSLFLGTVLSIAR